MNDAHVHGTYGHPDDPLESGPTAEWLDHYRQVRSRLRQTLLIDCYSSCEREQNFCYKQRLWRWLDDLLSLPGEGASDLQVTGSVQRFLAIRVNAFREAVDESCGPCPLREVLKGILADLLSLNLDHPGPAFDYVGVLLCDDTAELTVGGDDGDFACGDGCIVLARDETAILLHLGDDRGIPTPHIVDP